MVYPCMYTCESACIVSSIAAAVWLVALCGISSMVSLYHDLVVQYAMLKCGQSLA